MNIHKSAAPGHTFSYITIKSLSGLSQQYWGFSDIWQYGSWLLAFFFEASAAGIQGLHKGLSVTHRKSQTFLILTILQENWKIRFEVT